jgi:hypothetical protein
MSETEKEVVKAQDRILSDGLDLAGDKLTAGEAEYMEAAGSVSGNIITQKLLGLKTTGLTGAKNIARSLGRKTVQSHITTVLDKAQAMYDYEANEDTLGALRLREA